MLGVDFQPLAFNSRLFLSISHMSLSCIWVFGLNWMSSFLPTFPLPWLSLSYCAVLVQGTWVTLVYLCVLTGLTSLATGCTFFFFFFFRRLWLLKTFIIPAWSSSGQSVEVMTFWDNTPVAGRWHQASRWKMARGFCFLKTVCSNWETNLLFS